MFLVYTSLSFDIARSHSWWKKNVFFCSTVHHLGTFLIRLVVLLSINRPTDRCSASIWETVGYFLYSNTATTTTVEQKNYLHIPNRVLSLTHTHYECVSVCACAKWSVLVLKVKRIPMKMFGPLLRALQRELLWKQAYCGRDMKQNTDTQKNNYFFRINRRRKKFWNWKIFKACIIVFCLEWPSRQWKCTQFFHLFSSCFLFNLLSVQIHLDFATLLLFLRGNLWKGRKKR